MVGARFGRWSLAIGAVMLGLVVYATPAAAQSGVKGRVVDAQNKPVEGAKVTITQTDNYNRKFELRTKKNGDFVQVGVPAGDYKVTAEKDNLAQSFNVHVGLDIKEVNFTLKPGAAGGPMSKEDAAKEAARVEGIKTKFAEGAALSNEGKYDEAIAKFTEVLTDVPKCSECYANIGAVYAQKKEYDKAEESYKKALELNPESGDAYNGLATIYNAQKKFDEAEKASAEAAKRMMPADGAAGGNPEAFYNQGVIAWNGNNFAKAQEHFSNAIKANPNHAESHFMLGKVYLNLGKLPEAAGEFQNYLKIAPSGPNAKEAQTMLDGLKPYIK